MKLISLTAGAALLASTAMVQAGGIDRSGQSVGIIFEEGTYAELSFGYVDPTVSGEDPIPLPTGDLAPSYTMTAGGFRTDISDKIGVAVIFDQPFGSGADYPVSSPIYSNSFAELSSSAITAIASYDVTDNIIVYGGGVMQSMSASASLPFIPAPFVVPVYTVDAAEDSGFGYVVGAAYQIPEMALRVALTYRSEITTDHATVETGVLPEGGDTTTITTPQSINLEFKSGVNAKTLVFGSVRWVEWSKFHLSPPDLFNTPPGGTSLVDYENDTFTYSLGVGRKLTDTLSGAITVGYEAALGTDPTPLAPTDGNISLGAGLTYKMGNAEITAGAKYIWLGDSSAPLTVGSFADNNAVAFGLKIAFAI